MSLVSKTYFKMLPLNFAIISALSLGLTGCGDDSSTSTATAHIVKSIRFTGAAFPSTDEQQRSIITAPTANVNGKEYNIGYHTILRSGDNVGGNVFGVLYDINGNTIFEADGSVRISNDNDFASLLPVDGKLFMVSHFESRPGAMYLTELKQDSATGLLSPVSTKNIDFASIHGGWVHCAGSVTPWNSHLGSEEYEPDAAMVNPATGTKSYEGVEDSYYHAMDAYFGGERSKMNPYFWGFPIEVKVLNANGDTNVTKHYGMGRIAFELSYVMPDQKTVYSTDDGTNVGLYMFIADKAADLSAGTLYGAQFMQTGNAENGGNFDIKWINLGHAANAEIEAYINQKITFADIFNTAIANTDGTCPSGFTSINAGHEDAKHQCLQLKTGMELAASRLETRRYAAMMGVTTEIRKEEGITYDKDHKRLYLGISEATNGMEDNMKGGKANTKYDIGGPNHMKIAYNSCGIVYALDVDDNYQAKNMYPLVAGKMISGDPANSCDVNGIANPDNITYMPGYNTVIIGEDTGSGHQNDAIWAYNLDDKTLTRIQTTPYGSETTSPYFYPNINGWAYLMSVVQHPYGESDKDKLLPGSGDDRAYTGFVGPFPAMN